MLTSGMSLRLMLERMAATSVQITPAEDFGVNGRSRPEREVPGVQSDATSGGRGSDPWPVCGYRDEVGMAKDFDEETFCAM
jgi:hypothetical protein